MIDAKKIMDEHRTCSLRDLATHAGVSYDCIKAWRAGRRDPMGIRVAMPTLDALGFRLTPGNRRCVALRKLLVSRCINKSELARAINEPEPRVNAILNGHKDPSISWWLRVSKKLGVSIKHPKTGAVFE